MFISLTASIINIPLLNWSVYKNPANFTKQKFDERSRRIQEPQIVASERSGRTNHYKPALDLLPPENKIQP